MNRLAIAIPPHFDFAQCLRFLDRNAEESLHRVEGARFLKMLPLHSGPALFAVQGDDSVLEVELLAGDPAALPAIGDYVREMLDLERDMLPFYEKMKSDAVMGSLVHRFDGLRIIRLPDLFEALSWTIIGQQINLAFAYRLKARLVERCGTVLEHDGQSYHAFPTPEAVLGLDAQVLRDMQFSRQKADYLLSLAETMGSGKLSRSALEALPFAASRARLIALRGIGPWSADYVLMKCLGATEAFPIADVGLHNALRIQLGMDRKPTPAEIRSLAAGWRGWEAYCTFFLWQSLL